MYMDWYCVDSGLVEIDEIELTPFLCTWTGLELKTG